MSEIITYQDALDHLTIWQSGLGSADAQRFSRLALFAALRDFSQAHHWSYYIRHGRINTVAPYETGTIAYDHTGGSSERLVTLTSGTWPSTAADGTLRISDVNYDVASRVSDSLITLSSTSNPGSDVASGTSYTLYQDAYVLPSDFWTLDEVLPNAIGVHIEYVHPREWLAKTRYLSASSNYPQFYTVLGSDDYQGAMELVLYPYPDSAITLDFIYSRRPRRVVYEIEATGTVTTSASSTTITGTDTSFTDAMIGSIIRISDGSTSDEPTGREGGNPYAFERSITAVASTTSLTVDQAIDDTLSSVKYTISDPIDIDVGVMGTALFRCAEAQLGKLRRLEDRTALDAEYAKALVLAKEADVRSTVMRAVGGGRSALRMRDMPSADDVE